MFNEHKQGCALPFVRERERLDCLLYGKILCIGSFGGGIISKMCSPARHPHTFIWRSQPKFATLRSKQQTCPNQKSLPANMPIKMYMYISIHIYMCVCIIYIYSVCVCVLHILHVLMFAPSRLLHPWVDHVLLFSWPPTLQGYMAPDVAWVGGQLHVKL